MATDSDSRINAARHLLLEAMIDVGRWDAALEAVANACGARAGQLLSLNGSNEVVGHWLTGVPEGFTAMIEDWGFANPVLNPRFRAGLSSPLMTPVADQDYADADDRRRSPIYAEIYDPHDLPFNCQVVLQRDDEAFVRASVTRTRAQGPLDAEAFRVFEALAPHLQAAVRVQMSLMFVRCTATLQALDAVEAAAFLLSECGRVVGVSAAAEAIAIEGKILQVKEGRVRLRRQPDQTAFDDALGQILEAIRRGGCAAPPVSQLCADALVMDVQQLPMERLAFGGGPAAILILRKAKAAERSELLRRMFGLTRAEAEVALALAAGEAPEIIADARKVSVATVRTQLKSIYSKMGVHRQAELVAAVRRTSVG